MIYNLLKFNVMNKILVILWLCLSLNASAQYCLLFDIKVDEPEMVVSAMNDLMDTAFNELLLEERKIFDNKEAE